MADGKLVSMTGSAANASELIVTAETGSTVYIQNQDGKIKNASEKLGTWTFKNVKAGIWTIYASKGDFSTSEELTINKEGQLLKYEVLVGYFKAFITVTYPAGSTCTCTKDDLVLSADMTGSYMFAVPEAGDWIVACTNGSQSDSEVVTIEIDGDSKSVILKYFSATITVTYPEGSTCTCVQDDKILTATNTSGSYTFIVPSSGDWLITSTDGTNSATSTVSITADEQAVSVNLTYRVIPEFTYTGSYAVVNDSNSTITNLDTYNGNWKIRLLSTGTLTFSKLNGATDGIDVFMVGGGGNGATTTEDNGNGGAGGGGGYTRTQRGISISPNVAYSIGVGGSGGTSSGFGYSIGGGATPPWYSLRQGVAGGSGGGSAMGNGGSNGGNGGGYGTDLKGGTGQGSTTREFGESSGALYAGGGRGFAPLGNTSNGAGGSAPNTGGGGHGGWHAGISNGAGYSGIVIIRNKR